MRKLLALLVPCLVLPLAACDLTGPAETIHGTYTLKTVNGAVLPWLAFQAGADRYEIASGSVVLNEDGTFEDVTIYTVTEGGVTHSETERYEGTFAASTLGALLRPDQGQPYDAAIVGTTMTQEFGGFEYVYVK